MCECSKQNDVSRYGISDDEPDYTPPDSYARALADRGAVTRPTVAESMTPPTPTGTMALRRRAETLAGYLGSQIDPASDEIDEPFVNWLEDEVARLGAHGIPDPYAIGLRLAEGQR